MSHSFLPLISLLLLSCLKENVEYSPPNLLCTLQFVHFEYFIYIKRLQINIDVSILSRVITRGLVNSGRNSNLTIALIDKPGQLEGIAHVIAGLGGNVFSVQYDRSDPNMAINSCFITVGLETRDHAHLAEIKEALSKAGFVLVGSTSIGGDCKLG